MIKRAWMVILLMCGFSACQQEREDAYPYFCDCSCERCIVRDPATMQCQNADRQPFSLVTCAANKTAAEPACATACARFGTNCSTKSGDQASETLCN